MWQQIVMDICGTVVCSIGVFFIFIIGTEYLNGVLIREISLSSHVAKQEDSFMTTKHQNQSATHPTNLNETVIIRILLFFSIIFISLLSGFKLFARIVVNSGAMISDAVHSFSDVLTTLIAWIGVKVSKKDADASHPYGHERLECIASLILGFVLMATGFGSGKILFAEMPGEELLELLVDELEEFGGGFGVDFAVKVPGGVVPAVAEVAAHTIDEAALTGLTEDAAVHSAVEDMVEAAHSVNFGG